MAFANSAAACSWYAADNEEPLPCSVPDTGAPLVVVSPAVVGAPDAGCRGRAAAAAVVAELLLLLLPHAAPTSARASTPVRAASVAW